ncbi:similar to TRITHORAX-RELATED PROTEIN 5 [Actinidia rufa]|uniref:Similar to TRITHORAX-RELATED PROTEIN 5 n=1 Tax=Actinidia rufa TaxID=165716 RepID=A0A7J0EN21_9ERIC|nr:similar to TRITHORAX-RELATED PROTEIN 5 [Actinidia rufa]
MPPFSSAAAHRPSPLRRRRTTSTPPRKWRSMEDVMRSSKYAVAEHDDYSRAVCKRCGSGDRDEELLLCDRCDGGFHMLCLRPIVVRIPIGSWVFNHGPELQNGDTN